MHITLMYIHLMGEIEQISRKTVPNFKQTIFDQEK